MIIRSKHNGYVNGNNRLYPGGDSPAPAPSSQTVTQTSIPEYARPTVERMLGKAEAYSNAPYQAYGGERIAGFNPMQEQAFQATANLGPSRQLGAATQLAGQSGLGSLYAGQNYQNMATNPYATQAYMSPYIQNALAPQMDEARRQSDITGVANASQAAMQGAFGGSRQGLVEAERQSNLGTQLNSIYGQGMQNAFQNAQQAQQFGSTLGLQGQQAAANAAQMLGQLGQTQFGQQKDVIGMQSAAGSQQQGLQQQQLTQQYQDFLNQTGDPQKKLAFLSDMLRGLPMSQSVQQQYTAPTNTASQLAGLGAAGVGAYLKANAKEGGQVHGGLEKLALHNLARG